MLMSQIATRYIMPLREGGSLPAVVEADDGQMYVMKFSGAGQGRKALVAEVLAAELAAAVGLTVPEMVLLELDPRLARSEPDPEIRDLLHASAGLNLGFRYLAGAFEFNQLLKPPPSAELASAIVWFDAYILNMDRTPRNVNLLMWNDRMWLIDHGAAFYFHHDWPSAHGRAHSPYAMVRQHALLQFASQLHEAGQLLQSQLTDDVLARSVQAIPDAWLQGESFFPDLATHRAAYTTFLIERRAASALFLQEALNARTVFV